MNKIDTYELSKEISDVLSTEMNANAVKQKFAALSVTCLSSEEQRQALVQAIQDKCDPQKAEEIFSYTDKLVDEYTWRNTDDDMKKQLDAYHCTEPFVVLPDREQVMQYFEDKYPVFAIEKDGTYTVCQTEFDIKAAEERECLFGTSQFAIDDVMDYILTPEGD